MLDEHTNDNLLNQQQKTAVDLSDNKPTQSQYSGRYADSARGASVAQQNRVSSRQRPSASSNRGNGTPTQQRRRSSAAGVSAARRVNPLEADKQTEHQDRADHPARRTAEADYDTGTSSCRTGRPRVCQSEPSEEPEPYCLTIPHQSRPSDRN